MTAQRCGHTWTALTGAATIYHKCVLPPGAHQHECACGARTFT